MQNLLPYRGESLRYAVLDDVLEVTLDRAPCNEIGLGVLEELECLARKLESGPSAVRAMVLKSARPGGFSAGADLRALHQGLSGLKDASFRELLRGPVLGGGARARFSSRSSWAASWAAAASTVRDAARSPRRFGPRRFLRALSIRTFVDRIHRVFLTLDQLPVPVVAAVHGVCFGGGFELALTADAIVADKSARFAFPEARLGLIPGFGGVPRLRRDVGDAVVRDLLLSGRSIGARRAHEVGLVAQVAAEGNAPAVARRWARQMSRLPKDTLALGKRFAKPRLDAQLAEEKRIFCRLFESARVDEALAAFVEREDPMPYLPMRPA